jgi:hypothetical protein
MAERILLSDGQTLYDPKTWLTKAQAAELTGASTRTIERWAGDGTLKPLYYKQANQRAVAVFFKTDLEKVKRDRLLNPLPVRREPTPLTPTPPPSANHAILRQEKQGLPIPPFPTLPAVAWEALLTGHVVPLRDRVYLTLREAKLFTGLGEGVLKELAEKKKVKRWPGRKWLLRRADLEKL